MLGARRLLAGLDVVDHVGVLFEELVLDQPNAQRHVLGMLTVSVSNALEELQCPLQLCDTYICRGGDANVCTCNVLVRCCVVT